MTAIQDRPQMPPEEFEAVPFGKAITLPPPVGITLDTEPLKDWVR
ncbi:hypothetical protein ACI2L4_18875 [Streptomyces sparsogenes]